MKRSLAACLMLASGFAHADALITPVPAQAQSAQSTPSASGGGARVPGVVVEKPVPEGSEPLKQVTPHTDATSDDAIRKQADEAIKNQADDVSSACDAEFNARIDWTSISAQDIHLASPENTCGAVLDALRQVCETSEGRNRVQQDIKTVICTSGPTPSLSLRAGTLLYTLDWRSANPGAYAYAWLASHL